MRIAIDGTTLCAPDGSQGAGIEHYTWSIVQELITQGKRHEWFVSTPPALSQIRRRQLEKLGNHVTILPSYGPKMSFVTRHGLLPVRFGIRRPDVLFSPFGQVPLGWRGKSVITVHDVAIFEHPEWFPQKQDVSTKVLVPKSLDKATHIIAVSGATKQKLEKLFPTTAGKVSVVHEGVGLKGAYEALKGASEQTTRFPFDRDFIFFIGTIEPRKNLANAIRAFDHFLKSRPDQAVLTRFIIAGKKGWQTEEVESELLRVNQAWKHVEPNGVVQLLGMVTEEEKWHLMARASCLLYPSLDEGFGLPLLEAMAVGTPVITSDQGSLPEVGGDAAMYVSPSDIEAMSLALTQCLLIPEGVKVFQEEGIQRAAEFSWEKAGAQTLKILEQQNEV